MNAKALWMFVCIGISTAFAGAQPCGPDPGPGCCPHCTARLDLTFIGNVTDYSIETGRSCIDTMAFHLGCGIPDGCDTEPDYYLLGFWVHNPMRHLYCSAATHDLYVEACKDCLSNESTFNVCPHGYKCEQIRINGSEVCQNDGGTVRRTVPLEGYDYLPWGVAAICIVAAGAALYFLKAKKK